MTKISSMAMMDNTANRENPPRPRFHGPIFGHFGPPKANRPSAIGMMKEKNRKITVQDTTMEYTGVSPMEITEEPHTNSTDSAAPAQIAALGVRCLGDTLASALEKGRP